MTPKDYQQFGLYAKDFGISSMNLLHYKELQEFHNQRKLEGIRNTTSITPYGSLTPYILEERSLNVTVMDVFSRLMMERIIWVAGGVDDHMSTIVQAQLMFLDSIDNNDITMHIDSPGGSVKSGLSMVDVMDYIKSDIRTINTGMAASMGSVLLGAGTKGKRGSLRFSKVMLHQVSGGAGGNIQDAKIQMEEMIKCNDILFDLLGGYCNKTAEQVKSDATRDLWLDANESLSYGIIDEIVSKKKK
jgi:ATP-dependent Clp protease protease subunit